LRLRLQQVDKIGLTDVTSSGQVYFPEYQLAPYRILVTLLGVLLAFVFTIFPFPVTSRSILRRDVAHQFHLLSHMYGLTQGRIGLLVRSEAPARSAKLKDVMAKVGSKCIALQNHCRENLGYTEWEPSLETRFPAGTYAELLNSMQRYVPVISAHEVYSNFILSRMTHCLETGELNGCKLFLDLSEVNSFELNLNSQYLY
jgi:hypothetical protein